MLELQSVSKCYADTAETVRAVNRVSLTVRRGELVALVGPSGSGKTTLLLLAGGILEPDAGAVRVNDQDLAGLSRREAAEFRLAHLGFIYQSFHLLHGMSALDNVALPLVLAGMSRRRARKRAAPLFALVGLEERADHLPAQLSGGERQRVAIAKALVSEPKLVLADEPTGNLDTKRGAEVLALLTGLCHEREVAALLVSHDPRAVKYASRTHTLCDGELASDAHAETVGANPAVEA